MSQSTDRATDGSLYRELGTTNHDGGPTDPGTIETSAIETIDNDRAVLLLHLASRAEEWPRAASCGP